MSNPHVHSEMAHWLQDNLAKYLFHAKEEELAEFVEKVMPHLSNLGVRVIYPMVAECASFNPRSFTRHPAPTGDIGPDDEMPINYGGTK